MSSTPRTQSRRRLEYELKYLHQNPLDVGSAEPKEGNLFEWIGELHGPQASPYAGGAFELVFRFPNNYPLKPPTVTFATKIYHPNIDSDSGFIGLNILRNDWCAVHTVWSILLSLSAFLADPDYEDAVHPEIADEYKNDRLVYEQKAMEWTVKYAKRQSGDVSVSTPAHSDTGEFFDAVELMNAAREND